MDNLFTVASRSKFRFATPSGLLAVEDLWDLPLTGRGANLDDIAKGLHRDLKAAEGEVSFVKPAPRQTNELQVKFEIVKVVIETKLKERDERDAAATKAATKQRIMELIERKKDEAMAGKSIEDLQALLEKM